MIPTRQQALELLKTHTKSESLYRHALAVEAVMRYFAEREGEDPEKWGIIGLVHDIDWEKWPAEHCEKSKEILEEAGYPEDWIRAVLSHGWGIVTQVEPQHRMEKMLYSIDELTGLIMSTALVRPSRSLMDLTLKSVKKKWKDRRFSAGVNRDIIEKGATMLGMELEELIKGSIAGMQTIARDLDLA